MINFLTQYGLFLAKVVTLVLAIIAIMAFVAASKMKSKTAKNRIKVTKLNKHYEDYQSILQKETLSKEDLKKLHKSTKKEDKQKKKDLTSRKRIFVLNFNGDIKASATGSLREEITAILTVATPQDEVVVRLESPGGIVPCYGLAASQLQRLKKHQIPLTVSVDKIAASGGYMMACVADKILAAPYALIGSIGVVAQLPNFHRLLKKNEIDFEQITAGEFKRSISIFGENTEKGRQKVQEDVDNIHEIFKRFIIENRPRIEIDRVATGEHWHGVQALELNLIDNLSTSDDYLFNLSHECDLFEIQYGAKSSWKHKLSHSLRQAYYAILPSRANHYEWLQ